MNVKFTIEYKGTNFHGWQIQKNVITVQGELNKAFKILVKKNYSLKKPLIIYHSTNDKINSTNINLRLDFELGENSCLRLIDFFNDSSNF